MTGINYLDETWGPVTGCGGKGCKVRDRCWAKAMVKRFPAIHGFESFQDFRKRYNLAEEWQYVIGNENKAIPFDHVRFHPERLDKPLHWRKPRRIGVCFTGDWMDEQVQCEWIDQILEVIAACPQHQFFTLTKQSQNLIQPFQEWYKERWYPGYMPNLYNGVSICDQEDAARMLPELLRIPGKHWVSVEPMLGPVDFYSDAIGDVLCHCDGCMKMTPERIDFLVIGCESGPKRRPCPHEWMVDVVEQCQAAGVPCYVKQIDLNGRVCHDINLFPESLKVRELPCAT